MLQLAAVGINTGLVDFVLTVLAGYLFLGLVMVVMGLLAFLWLFSKMRGEL